MEHWAKDAIFYHIYPLGFCGAPEQNDFVSPPVERLDRVGEWLDHIQGLGANAIYLGPVFEATAHGYDTADYYRVDRRLGTNDTLARLTYVIHERGMRVILDGVFNHVGRDFWAFRDVQAHGEASAYRDWFRGLDFGARSPYGDPFGYESWNGCYDLVRLNGHNPAVRDHLFQAISMWVRDFGIDGLRLDVADCLELDFLRDLAACCRTLRPVFWLMGEGVHGDYRKWGNDVTLDSVTNYECYKGLYSSHVDTNYFEIAYSFKRQFGDGGMYQNLPLYAFADNHDVNRVASSLNNPAHLYPLYGLLFTMPGVPSIYYGSEWGIEGRKNGSDAPLRPALNRGDVERNSPNRDLAQAIRRLAAVRHQLPALRHGDYQQLVVKHEQFAFARQISGQRVIVAVNAANHPAAFDLPGRLVDVLDGGERFSGTVTVPPCWLRVLVVE